MSHQQEKPYVRYTVVGVFDPFQKYCSTPTIIFKLIRTKNRPMKTPPKLKTPTDLAVFPNKHGHHGLSWTLPSTRLSQSGRCADSSLGIWKVVKESPRRERRKENERKASRTLETCWKQTLWRIDFFFLNEESGKATHYFTPSKCSSLSRPPFASLSWPTGQVYSAGAMHNPHDSGP